MDNYIDTGEGTVEYGLFEVDGEVWTERITYDDGTHSYGRSHAPRLTIKPDGRGGMYSGIVAVLILVVTVSIMFFAPLKGGLLQVLIFGGCGVLFGGFVALCIGSIRHWWHNPSPYTKHGSNGKT